MSMDSAAESGRCFGCHVERTIVRDYVKDSEAAAEARGREAARRHIHAMAGWVDVTAILALMVDSGAPSQAAN